MLNSLSKCRFFFCSELGTKLINEGSYQKAYEVYTEALKIIPLSPDAKSKLLFNRALMSSKLGKLHDTNCHQRL